MTAVFAFAAVVQWNDPDPIPWIAFYLLAAAASLGVALGRAWWWLELASFAVAAAVLFALAPSLADARVEAVTSFHMKSSEDEHVRELAGAAIALVWTAALLLRRCRLRRRAP